MSIPPDLERLLRHLTVADEATVDQLMHGHLGPILDPKTSTLVEIAALVAVEADGPSYQAAIDKALAAGVEDEEVLETVMTITPLVGAARLGSALSALIATFEGSPVD